ncbi:MAG: penicillin acylase family protein [Xanthomonadales bacterium]|nr:penicillin acylase family protein [Xanthomonadales bacterium]
MRTITRRPRALACALWLGLAALAGGSAAQAQSIPAPGLHAPGTITYDANGVPTITADSDTDAAWLMGYAHARDRFFQMDQLRRVASGTFAELVGSAALSSDVQFRTLGLRRAAQKSWTKQGSELRAQLRAYADGVNAWLATNPLPLEYGALELTHAKMWTPVDSLVIGKLLALQLSFDDETGYTARLAAYSQAGAAAGFNGAALFFEDTHRSAPADGRVSIPDFFGSSAKLAGQGWSMLDKRSELRPSQLELLQTHVEAVQNHPILGPLLNRRENRAGSNWWMVSGEHTVSGRPILSNDPHLSLGTPTLFHEAHIVSNDAGFAQPMNTVGLVAPGTPLPLLGCTDAFCWGLTTNSLDVTDWFFDSFVVNSYGLPTHSIHNGVREPVLWVFQSYFVNRLDGVPDNVTRENSIGYLNGAVTVLVPRRNFGPMLVAPDASGEGVTVQYTGWGATFELEAFRKINRATSLSEFQTAVLNFDVGSQNFAYAGKDGNIAYFVSAEAPIREDLQQNTINGLPPYLVRNGTGGNEWATRTNVYPGQASLNEVLSPAEMPQVVNPSQGYIANANNDPVGGTLDNNPFNEQRPGGGIYYLAQQGSPYRMGRIDRKLQELIARGGITVADMAQLQANTQSLDAELILPYLLQAYDNAPACSVRNDPKVAEAIDYLARWDFSAPTGIAQGYDAGDNPFALGAPSDAEIDASVAATLWAMFRSQVIRGTIDHTLTQVGLGSFRPGGSDAYTGLKRILDTFPQLQGRGASGLDFFTRVPSDVSPTASAATRRDCVLLDSLKRGIDRLASSDFAAAFNGSTNLRDYRWGRLHRIVFAHPLGAPLSIPSDNGYPFMDLGPGLPGLARPGGFQVVDASSHDLRADGVNSFMFGSGPVRRFIGEMTDTPTLMQIMPGGQDGNIGGPGYISQLPLWLVNGYKPLVIDPAVSAQSAIATLQFAPQP